MWRNITELQEDMLQEFEKHFSFLLHGTLHAFLLTHNYGCPSPGRFPTDIKDRKISSLLDFSSKTGDRSAWAVNERLRKQIGPQRIIIGIDSLGNYICVERKYQEQRIVLWNHITNCFEPCQWEISEFLRNVG